MQGFKPLLKLKTNPGKVPACHTWGELNKTGHCINLCIHKVKLCFLKVNILIDNIQYFQMVDFLKRIQGGALVQEKEVCKC